MQGNMKSGRITKSALVGTTAMLAGLVFTGMAGGAYAQDKAADQGTVKEVVVTGSRIAKRDFTSDSPMVTVTSQAFENTADVAVEATLNKLPQFTPDQNLTGVQAADVQPTATHTVGISTASLRGLGSNRTLVLADGQRLQPVNGSLVVDLNSIPSALIDHVEVVTGGASAVYGADAVAGVVNFILKKNYQGLDVQAQYSAPQAGDGQQFTASAVFGSNFADDKGNITFALEHYTRAASYEKNRGFYTKGWGDPTTGTNEFFDTGAYFDSLYNVPAQFIFNPVALASVFGSTPVSGIGWFGFNNNQTLNNLGPFGGAPNGGSIVNYTGKVDGKYVAYQDFVNASGNVVQGIKTNQVDLPLVTSPLNRYSMYGDAHYDINDSLTAYIKGSFTSTHTSTTLFSTPFITGWATVIPYNEATDDPASPGYIAPGQPGAQHPVPAQLATLLNNRLFGPNQPWELWFIPSTNGSNPIMPPRSTVDDNDVYQVTAGLQGKFPVNDWTWELFGTHGQATDYTQGNGDASLARYEAILMSPDYGAGQSFLGNNVPWNNNGFGTQAVTCTSGFYGALFEGQTPSKDCINAITATLQSRVLEAQTIVEFDSQGTLFRLPAGDVKLSLGADYREEHLQYTPDILQSTVSFLDQAAGLYPASYEDATTEAREGYGELLVPVLADLPGVKHFNLELGARYSTYTATDHTSDTHITPPGGWTYKILGDWQINDWARLRGGYNLSVRSPNVGELFLAKEQVYAAASTVYGDPCSLASTAPFGAGGAAKDPFNGATYKVYNSKGAAGAQSAYLICQALMGSGANVYYTANSNAAQPAAGATPFIFTQLAGNPNLQAEKAHTWTAGLVLSSPWRDNPWADSLRASIDWYDIKVNGAIELSPPDLARSLCLEQTATTLAQAQAIAATPACLAYNRSPANGQENYTYVQYSNLATIRTSGIDFQVDDAWNFSDIGLSAIPGRLQVNWLATYLLRYDALEADYAGAPGVYTHWAGSLGPTLEGIDPGAGYKFKMNTSLTYLEGPLSLTLGWRFLPHVHSAGYPLQATAPGGNAACGQTSANGGANCTLDTSAYNVFDLSATYTVKRNYILRAGVNNLFGVNPPTTAATSGQGTVGTPGYVIPSSGQGTTQEGLYDAIGREFYVGINAKF